MTSKEFDQLIERYHAGECTPQELAYLDKWAEANIGEEARKALDMSAFSVQNVYIWKKIEVSTGIVKSFNSARNSRLVMMGVAACMTFMLLAFLLVIQRQSSVSDEGAFAGVETKNTRNSANSVHFPDGSVVVLEPGSSVIVDENYGEISRTVRLKGEAFFDIKKNAEKPFLVFTGGLVTEVLGTSFRIKPETANKTVEVIVLTGKVSVYTRSSRSSNKKDGVIITPNQKVVYDTEQKSIRQDLVDVPKILIPNPKQVDFSFDEASVVKVLSVMKEAYGLEIVLGNQTLNQCIFTGDLGGLDMYHQLDFFCEVINARYEIRGTTIFINGSGSCRSH